MRPCRSHSNADLRLAELREVAPELLDHGATNEPGGIEKGILTHAHYAHRTFSLANSANSASRFSRASIAGVGFSPAIPRISLQRYTQS